MLEYWLKPRDNDDNNDDGDATAVAHDANDNSHARTYSDVGRNL